MTLFQAIASHPAMADVRESGSRLFRMLENLVTTMEPSTWMLLVLVGSLIWMGVVVRAPR